MTIYDSRFTKCVKIPLKRIKVAKNVTARLIVKKSQLWQYISTRDVDKWASYHAEQEPISPLWPEYFIENKIRIAWNLVSIRGTLPLIHQDLDTAGGFAPRPQTTSQVNNREIFVGIGLVSRVRQAVHIANVLTLGSNPTKVNKSLRKIWYKKTEHTLFCPYSQCKSQAYPCYLLKCSATQIYNKDIGSQKDEKGGGLIEEGISIRPYYQVEPQTLT